MSFCVWLLSLSIMVSRSIHSAACSRTSFLFTGRWGSTVRTYHFALSLQVSMDTWVAYCGYAVCFYSCEVEEVSVPTAETAGWRWGALGRGLTVRERAKRQEMTEHRALRKNQVEGQGTRINPYDATKPPASTMA